MAAWPRRRGSRRNSGELACVAVAYQALSADTGRSNGVLGRRWSYCGGAGVARRELASQWRRRRRGGARCCACGEEGSQKRNGSAGRERAVAGVMQARPGASWPGWAEQRQRAAVFPSTRRPRPDGGRPRRRDSVRQLTSVPILTTSFGDDLSSNP